MVLVSGVGIYRGQLGTRNAERRGKRGKGIVWGTVSCWSGWQVFDDNAVETPEMESCAFLWLRSREFEVGLGIRGR